MALAIVTIIGTLASLVGIYAIADTRRNRKVKALGYENTGPFPLATTTQHEVDYQLTIHYRPGESAEDEVIEAAWVTYLRFANFGKEAIRAQDNAPANPLRIQVENVRVLDISLAASHRDVTRIKLGEPDLGEKVSSAALEFDFLDQHDGGLVRILSTAWKGAEFSLLGDIIGMPAGIHRTDEPLRKSSRLGKLGFGLYAVGQVASLGLAAYVVRLATGEWENVWLLLVPVVAVLGPIATALVVAETVWPTRARPPKYPSELALPRWLPWRGPGGEVFMPGPYFLEEASPASGDDREQKAPADGDLQPLGD